MGMYKGDVSDSPLQGELHHLISVYLPFKARCSLPFLDSLCASKLGPLVSDPARGVNPGE